MNINNKIYSNKGNIELLSFIPATSQKILDVGCGSGDNAKILSELGKEVTCITISESEKEVAKIHCNNIILADIEKGALDLTKEYFDVILFSHVLEHLINPTNILINFEKYLKKNGTMLIAVPNMAYWRHRIRMLKGNWERENDGPFDNTHLHFWSFNTINNLIIDNKLKIEDKIGGTISIPLWPIRKLFPGFSKIIDKKIGALFPNLFAYQTILILRKNA